jgi:hypothetical protein
VFTPEQKRQLRHFCEVCDDIAACRFINDFHSQPHHIFVGTLPDGTVKDEWPRYDDNDFRAFLTHYRKLRLEDDTKFERIVKLVKLVSDTNDRQKLDYFKSEIKAEGQGWWGASLENENGEQILFTQEEVEDLILNGEVFHTNPEKRVTLKKLTGEASLMKAVAFWNYLRFVRTVVFYASETAKMIRENRYLD